MGITWNVWYFLGENNIFWIRFYETFVKLLVDSNCCKLGIQLFWKYYVIVLNNSTRYFFNWRWCLLSICHLGLSSCSPFVILVCLTSWIVLPSFILCYYFGDFGKKGKKECVFHFVETRSKHCLYLQNILKFLMKFWESEQKF